MKTKLCNMCNQEKPHTQFYKEGEREYLKQPCKACHLIRCREYRARPGNKERAAEISKYSAIKTKYGLSRQEYIEMSERGCEICGSKDQLAVDHDHGCCPGKRTCGLCVRGMLCKRHNWAAGNLNDSPEEALALSNYLKKTRVA